MKNRKAKSIDDWINEFDPTLGESIFEDGMMSPEAFDKLLGSKFNLPMNKYEVRVRRKNGKIETHILYSDGSMNMEAHQVVELKKGDKFI